MQDDKPKVKSIHEVVVAVKDAGKAAALYEELFDLKFDLGWELPWEKMKVKAAKIGETQFHFIEPTSPDSVVAKFIENKGEGLNHICFKVSGLSKMIERFREKGIKLVPEKPVSFGNISYIFVHPSMTQGVLVELVEEI